MKISLPNDLTFNCVMIIGLVWNSFEFIRSGLNALQTEPLWTGAVLIPWVLALALGAIALLLLVSKPVFYIDPPGKTGTVWLQWAVTTLVINQRTFQFQLYTPFRRHWMRIPVGKILLIEQFDEGYTVLLRHYHSRYCILRGQRRDYLISAELTLAEQTWLVAELKELLNYLQHQ